MTTSFHNGVRCEMHEPSRVVLPAPWPCVLYVSPYIPFLVIESYREIQFHGGADEIHYSSDPRHR
jgi:hypothetical protein